MTLAFIRIRISSVHTTPKDSTSAPDLAEVAPLRNFNSALLNAQLGAQKLL